MQKKEPIQAAATTLIGRAAFPVSDIEPARELLPEVPYKQAVEHLLSAGATTRLGEEENRVAALASSLDTRAKEFGQRVQKTLQKLAVVWKELYDLAGTGVQPWAYRQMILGLRTEMNNVLERDTPAYHIPSLFVKNVVAAHRERLALELQQAERDLEARRRRCQRFRSIESCSSYRGQLVADVVGNPVIAALHKAFCDHRPLCLSPDAMWLLVIQGVAHHINMHAEILRKQFVKHEGKLLVQVRRDDFVKGSPENPWAEVIEELSFLVQKHIGQNQDRFTPRFSTTGPIERTAASIVLLDAMQSYFQYKLFTMCGIPAISLQGTPEDWQQLSERTMAFRDLGLDWWITPLQPILHELVRSASGEIDQPFWQSIYKYESFSGGNAVTGWINAFFPYLKGKQPELLARNRWLAEGGARLEALLSAQHDPVAFGADGPGLDQFPSGLAVAPFLWDYRDQELFNMEFISGFVGVKQDPTTMTLCPEIGWAIREA